MERESLHLGVLTVGHEIDTGRLATAFFAEDDIGVMVRCHFEVERAATRALDTLTGSRWKKVRCQYLSEKLNLLEVLGAPERLLAPARTLNKQRNEFAHDGLEEISEQQGLDLSRAVRAFVPQFHDDFQIDIGGKRTFSAKLRDCTARQRYVISSAVLAMFVGGIPEMLFEHHKQKQAANAS